MAQHDAPTGRSPDDSTGAAPAGSARRSRMPPLTLYPALLFGSFNLTWPLVLAAAVLTRLARTGIGDQAPGPELWLGLGTLLVAPALVIGVVRRRPWGWPLLLVYTAFWTGLCVAAAHWLDIRALLPGGLMLAATVLAMLPPARSWFEPLPEPEEEPAPAVVAAPPGRPRLTVVAGGRDDGSAARQS